MRAQQRRKRGHVFDREQVARIFLQQLRVAERRRRDDRHAGIERFEQQMATFTDPELMFEHHYVELTPELIEQREEFRRELAADAAEADGHA